MLLQPVKKPDLRDWEVRHDSVVIGDKIGKVMSVAFQSMVLCYKYRKKSEYTPALGRCYVMRSDSVLLAEPCGVPPTYLSSDLVNSSRQSHVWHLEYCEVF